jgi:hypothetical protein
MIRLAHHLFTLSSALSLLTCVAVCLLWVRSYAAILSVHRTDVTTPGKSKPDWNSKVIKVGWGQLSFDRTITRADPAEHVTGIKPTGTDGWTVRSVAVRPGWQKPPVGMGTGTFWNHLGFGRVQGNGMITINGVPPPGYSQVTTRYEMPLWLVALVAAGPPVGVIFRRVQITQRVRHGHCLICGYDMRATPDRCPECGAFPSVKAAT